MNSSGRRCLGGMWAQLGSVKEVEGEEGWEEEGEEEGVAASLPLEGGGEEEDEVGAGGCADGGGGGRGCGCSCGILV